MLGSLDHLWLSLSISVYLWLSLIISDYFWLSVTILGYLYKISSIRGQVEAGESKLLLFETFPLFDFFTRASSRARAPKKYLVKVCMASVVSKHLRTSYQWEKADRKGHIIGTQSKYLGLLRWHFNSMRNKFIIISCEMSEWISNNKAPHPHILYCKQVVYRFVMPWREQHQQ